MRLDQPVALRGILPEQVIGEGRDQEPAAKDDDPTRSVGRLGYSAISTAGKGIVAKPKVRSYAGSHREHQSDTRTRLIKCAHNVCQYVMYSHMRHVMIIS